MLIELNDSIQSLIDQLEISPCPHSILVATSNRPLAWLVVWLFFKLSKQQSHCLIGVATTSQDALDSLDSAKGPVLVCVSEVLDEGRGVDLVKDLKLRSLPQAPIETVLLLESEDPALVREALSGPSNVVLAEERLNLHAIIHAWDSILNGERFVDPLLSASLFQQGDPHAHGLSIRERMVLQLICDGLTNREISEQLTIAETTARGHVQSIMRKLDVRHRTAAAVEGIRRRWVS